MPAKPSELAADGGLFRRGRRASPGSRAEVARRGFKRFALATFAAVSGGRQSARDRVAVLVYHRVSDRYRDNMTCGVEAFDRHMAYLADHHHVVPLSRLLEGPLPAGEGPVVAITFDDGYLDNYEIAAPILARHGLTATFFVATHIVDERLPFLHDTLAKGHSVPTMTWEQMRQMQKAGFTFGGHTAHHVNLADVDDAVAEAELARSRDMLRAELGVERPMFAYPFGRGHDMTPARLEQVKAAGYSCNCSAYGGVNSRTVDRWNILRCGIDHNFGLAELRSRLFGWDAFVARWRG